MNQKSKEREQFYMSSLKKEDRKDEPIAGRADRREDKQFNRRVHSTVYRNTKVTQSSKGK